MVADVLVGGDGGVVAGDEDGRDKFLFKDPTNEFWEGEGEGGRGRGLEEDVKVGGGKIWLIIE